MINKMALRLLPSEAKEFIETANRLNIEVELLNKEDSQKYIEKVLNSFKPFRVTGHLGIGDNSISISLDENEFSYSENLDQESGYVFFEQYNSQGKTTVIKIVDVRKLGEIIADSFGMEYFLSNEKIDYLIAVNWYVVEISGTAKEKFNLKN